MDGSLTPIQLKRDYNLRIPILGFVLLEFADEVEEVEKAVIEGIIIFREALISFEFELDDTLELEGRAANIGIEEPEPEPVDEREMS